MKKIKIPEQLVDVRVRMDEIQKEQEKNREEARKFYNAKMKKEEVNYSEINTKIAKRERKLSDIINSFCKFDVHLYSRILLNMNWEPLEDSESESYFEVSRCVLCGKIISVKKITTELHAHYTFGVAHYYNKRIGEEDIPEEAYKSKLTELPAFEITFNEEILNVITDYQKYSMVSGDYKMFFGALQRKRAFVFSKYGESEVLPLMQQYINNYNILEKLRKDKENLSTKIEKKNQDSRDELCSLFGHNVPSGKKENDTVVCKCCNRHYLYVEAIKTWEEAPFKGILFEKPTIKVVEKQYVERTFGYNSLD